MQQRVLQAARGAGPNQRGFQLVSRPPALIALSLTP